jgi:hypothetical protein
MDPSELEQERDYWKHRALSMEDGIQRLSRLALAGQIEVKQPIYPYTLVDLDDQKAEGM